MPCVSTRFETHVLSYLGNEFNLTQESYSQLNFNLLISQHLILSLEYNVLSTYLRNTLALRQTKNQEIDAELIAQILIARKIAIFLAYIYDKHLNVPRETARLLKDEVFFRALLNQPSSPLEQQLHNPWPATQRTPSRLDTQTIRNKHIIANWIRVFAVRCRRLLNSLHPFIDNNNSYHPIMKSIEKIANPFFSHFAWVFYIPRLVTNIGIVLKHLLPHPWMSKEEESLAFSIRCRAQLKRRWFEFANDSVWLASGVLCAFLLVGSLLPVANYFIAALYVYDVFLASLRAYVELNRLYQLKRDYQDAQAPQALQKELNCLIAFEKRRLYINISCMTALTVAIAFTLPILVGSGPLFPLIGAALLVAVTLLSFIILKQHEKTKPITLTPPTSSLRFFKSAEPQTNTAEPSADTRHSSSERLNNPHLVPSS